MNEEQDSRNRYFSLRQVLDYGIAIIYLCLAYLFAFPEKFNLQFTLLPEKGMRFAFAGLIGLYGLWRLYRGIRKNY